MQMLSQEKISVKPIKIDNDFKEGISSMCMMHGGVNLESRHEIKEMDHLQLALNKLATRLAKTCIMHVDFGINFNPGNIVYNLDTKEARLIDFDFNYIHQINLNENATKNDLKLILKDFWNRVMNVYFEYYKTRFEKEDEDLEDDPLDVADEKMKECKNLLEICVLGEKFTSINMDKINIDNNFIRIPPEPILFQSKLIRDRLTGMMAHETQTHQLMKLDRL